jgi:hypothetical protein
MYVFRVFVCEICIWLVWLKDSTSGVEVVARDWCYSFQGTWHFALPTVGIQIFIELTGAEK